MVIPVKQIILQPKLVVHLQKTEAFDEIYEKWEETMKKAAEEHKEDIEAVEASVVHNPDDAEVTGSKEESKET